VTARISAYVRPQSGGRKNRQPLTGEPFDAGALWRELPARIAAAFPGSGGRGRPSRPSARSVYRGVMVRESLRAGYPTAQLHLHRREDGRQLVAHLDRRGVPDRKALGRWEAAVQRLERAEELPTPAIPHDLRAFQAVTYAVRRYLAWNQTSARAHSWEAAAEVMSLRQDVDRAIAAATGQRRENASPDWIIETLEREAELRRLVAEQAEDERRDLSHRFRMPGSGCRPSPMI
jgi:hypothetical protein